MIHAKFVRVLHFCNFKRDVLFAFEFVFEYQHFCQYYCIFRDLNVRYWVQSFNISTLNENKQFLFHFANFN